MNDADEFFVERDRRMSIPDEDVDEYIQMRLALGTGTRRNQSTEGRVYDAAPHTPIGPRKQSKRSFGLGAVGEESNAELMNSGNEPASVSLAVSSSSPLAADRCAKRRKIMEDRSIPNKTDDRLVRRGVPVGLVLDPSTSRMAPGRNEVVVENLSEVASENPIRTTVSRRVLPRNSSQSNMSSSTRLPSGSDRDPMTSCVWTEVIRTADQAVPVTNVCAHFTSANANTLASDMKVVAAPKGRKRNTSMHDDPSVSETFSAQLAPSRSTTFDGHGKDDSRLPEEFPHFKLSPADTIPRMAKTTLDSTSRTPDDPHEAPCFQEAPMPSTPAGFNAALCLDVSNITGPEDLLSGQPHHANEGRRVPSTEGQLSSSNPLLPKEPKTRRTVNSDRRSRRSRASSKQVKEKPKLITPLEYAQKLQSCPNLQAKTDYLKGKRIFYVGGDMTYASSTTRGRMDYIVKHGGTLVSKYDPAIVTHIVTDAGVRHTLHALSLKSLSEIPDHIPTVTWSWIISGNKRASKRESKLLSEMSNKGKSKAGDDHDDGNNSFDFEFMHAAFAERIDAGSSWKIVRRNKKPHDHASRVDDARDDNGDVSHISTFSQESKSSQTGERRVTLTVLPPAPLDLKLVDTGKTDGQAPSEEKKKARENDDPLAEYYAQARAEREAQWNRDASDSDEGDDDADYPRVPVPRRGFACDLKGQKQTVSVNQHIVDKLEALRELHKAKSSDDDRWRAYSYGKCIPAIRNYPKPIRSFGEARSIRGVGEKTALKIMEIINTGDLRRIRYENTEDVAATRTFQGIYGVGRNTAFTWFASGLRTLDDVRAGKGGLKLTTAQEIGLKYYDNINSRMPREEAKKIFDIIKPIALAIDSKLFIEIMGSYRRGKADCGDIDILITRSTTDGKTHQGVLRTLLEKLHAVGIITEDLAVPDDFEDLELIYRGLCKLPEPGAKRRRIDFLCVPWVSRGAALLYYTGDDIFNRAMRLKANKHGYSLNQRGLYTGVVRDPHDRQKKLCQGHIVASETEQEIFDILGVPWQEPHERVRS